MDAGGMCAAARRYTRYGTERRRKKLIPSLFQYMDTRVDKEGTNSYDSHQNLHFDNKSTIQPAIALSKVQILEALQVKIENQQIALTNPDNPNPSVLPSVASPSQQEDDGIDLDLD
eukprot:jgi/Psemu1/32822/gm1.32822_g